MAQNSNSQIVSDILSRAFGGMLDPKVTETVTEEILAALGATDK